MSYSNVEKAIIQFQQGDKEALEVIYNLYKAPLYQFIFRYTNNEQLSIDLVQDTFEKLQRKSHLYDVEKGKFKTYLYQIAYNTMMTRLRRQTLFRKLMPILADRQTHYENSDEKITIQTAIRALPEDLRAVVLLTYYHDLTQKEISAILQIPVGTVKSKLHRALKKLKEELEVNEVE
ncbi:RNA polymerase sigma factor [Bacillus sinesaloumensis]|uniref:RNA polymerase sigma factor n=1 Tax=Litchfieldia sinesaloumensis TaxID=1926280 RepID=UPI0009883286|nr:RNA polymerase sigma factor [Bacillus sinesaloumensis]